MLEYFSKTPYCIYSLEKATQFLTPPYITGMDRGAIKRRENTNPHTHIIENFHCGPTNLNLS